MEKQKRKLAKHIEYCIWKNTFQNAHKKIYEKKKKSYYFRKQIEVALRLYKKLK